MKAIKVRIYPKRNPREVIAKTVGCCRFIYNWALEKRIAFYQSEKKSIHKYELINGIADLKKENEWLREVPSQALQQSVFDLDSAFSHFFKKNNAFPKFKSKKNARQSYRMPQGFEINRDSHYIKLPKLGWVRFIDEFHVPENAVFKNVTVSRECDQYYAAVCYDVPKKQSKQFNVKESKTLGIDLGIKTLATLSDGTKIDNPKHLKKYEAKIIAEQRCLAKKEVGKKSYDKQKLKLAKAHRKVRNTRLDFLHKLTTSLVDNQNWTSFCIEDLAVRDMQQNRFLAKSIGDVGWRMFRSMMEYKCEDRGKNLIVIGRFEPSSKTCTCGVVNADLSLSDRTWTCSTCNVTHDRDILAANNIKTFGLRAGQSPLAVKGHRTPRL